MRLFPTTSEYTLLQSMSVRVQSVDMSNCHVTCTTTCPSVLYCSVKETQCLEFVQRILEGQKLPWIKGQLESLLSKEEARITILEALQVQLEVKVVQDKSQGSHLCELSQIVSVSMATPSFEMNLLIQGIEQCMIQ